jgi:hypothetical protein
MNAAMKTPVVTFEPGIFFLRYGGVFAFDAKLSSTRLWFISSSKQQLKEGQDLSCPDT